jgi:predicted DNA binding CopG/RHH family protein
MSYSDFLKVGAGETELRSYLVDGDIVPVTMRIPANLRDSAKEAAALRGISFSAFVRSCMIDELAKGGRR